MRLTVLGASASFAGADQACAGYLVESGDSRVLLDCGNGVLANLARVADPYALDAVFVTHEHTDHFADLYALQAMLRYAPSGPLDPLPLYLPEGLFERMKCLLSERGASEFSEAFIVHELEDAVTVEVGGLAVTPLLVEHAEHSFALLVEDETARLCYTSDAKPTEAVQHAATSVNLLLAEATLPAGYEGRAPHMTAAQAAHVAWAAGAARLVLTHIWPTNDRDAALREACAVFDGPVSIAEEFDVYEVAPGTGA
jgi:ribonuclease BN (tRNA processing enzyme)